MSEQDDIKSVKEDMLKLLDFLIINAVRYAIGRQTYTVSETCDWLVENWSTLSDTVRAQVQVDLSKAFKADDEARARGSEYRPLGDGMDRQQWERVRALWKEAL